MPDHAASTAAQSGMHLIGQHSIGPHSAGMNSGVMYSVATHPVAMHPVAAHLVALHAADLHTLALHTSSLLASGGSSPSPLWYATRATGVVALLLLTATVALGVAGIARVDAAALPRVVRAGLHRNVSLLALAFVCVHVVTTVLDPFTSISIVSAVVPFSSSYRPLWLGLGAIAFDLLLALIVTSLLRSRLPYRAWQAVHWLAYACWPIALWHGLGTGTDSRLPWLLLLDAACVLVVAGAVLWRLRLADNNSVRLGGMIATSAFVLATIVFVAVGPLQHGWAKRAGTPQVGPMQVRSAQVRPAQVGPMQVRSAQPRSAQLSSAQLRSAQVTSAQTTSAQVTPWHEMSAQGIPGHPAGHSGGTA